MLKRTQFSPQTTVEDIIKLALPSGTRVVAGETGLGREALWAVAQRSRLPAFPYLKGGEIALISMESHLLTFGDVPFSQLVRQLADKGVAAVAVVGEIPPDAEELANSLSIPLLALPEGANIRELESDVSRTIAEHRTELYNWEMELHRRFTRISVSEEGVPAIIQTLADITGCVAILEDDKWTLQLASSNLDSLGLPHHSIGGHSTDWPKTLDVGQGEAPMKKCILPGTELARLTAPIVIRKSVISYLSLLGPPDMLDELRRHALSAAAAACAMEMGRKLAIVEVENRFKGEFIDSLVEGAFQNNEEVSNRGRNLGYDPNRPYLVAVARLDSVRWERQGLTQDDGIRGEGEARFAALFLDELNRLGTGCIARAKEDGVIVLCPLLRGEANAVARIEAALEKARRLALGKMPGVEASVGLGRHHPGSKGIPISYQEALQALTVAQSLLGGAQCAYYGSLTAYRLLYQFKDSPELRELHEETLGKLTEYDRKSSGGLVDTLEAFFSCDGDIEKAARHLFVHRNTLAYRLRRIQQLTGLDLKKSEDSFRLQLALKTRKLIQAYS